MEYKDLKEAQEIQLKELRRLLETTEDEDRRGALQSHIDKLQEGGSNQFSPINGPLTASILGSFQMEMMESLPTKNTVHKLKKVSISGGTGGIKAGGVSNNGNSGGGIPRVNPSSLKPSRSLPMLMPIPEVIFF